MWLWHANSFFIWRMYKITRVFGRKKTNEFCHLIHFYDVFYWDEIDIFYCCCEWVVNWFGIKYIGSFDIYLQLKQIAILIEKVCAFYAILIKNNNNLKFKLHINKKFTCSILQTIFAFSDLSQKKIVHISKPWTKNVWPTFKVNALWLLTPIVAISSMNI